MKTCEGGQSLSSDFFHSHAMSKKTEKRISKNS